MFIENRKIPAWLRAAAVRQAQEPGWTHQKVADQLRVARETVTWWARQQAAEAASEATPEEVSIAALKARLANLETDNRIFRQALAGAWMTVVEKMAAGSAEGSLGAPVRGLPDQEGIPEVPLRPVVPLSSIPRQQDDEASL